MAKWEVFSFSNSSVLRAMAWVVDNPTLRLFFDSGAFYDYDLENYDEVIEIRGFFESAENRNGSVGRVYYDAVKGMYESTKVSDDSFGNTDAEPTYCINAVSGESEETYQESDFLVDEKELVVERDSTRTIQQLDELIKFHTDKVMDELGKKIYESIYYNNRCLSENELKYIKMMLKEK